MADQEPFKLDSQTLGALPIVDLFLARMGVCDVLGRYLPPADRRACLEAAVAIGLLVRNLCVAREPLYGRSEWAGRFDPRLLGLEADEVELLNDDRVGRALDQLFDADRASLLCELVVGVISEFEIDCSQLHNDSTSITLHGAYAQADGRARAGKPTPKAALGHSKDHRPDLKQLMLMLTVSADGAVPLAHRVLDGNTDDDQTHIETWEGVVRADRPHRLLLRRRLQALNARADGPHPRPRRALGLGAAALARRGLTDPRSGRRATRSSPWNERDPRHHRR